MAVMSLNDRAELVAKEMIERQGELGVMSQRIGTGLVIDAGVDTMGSLNAGLFLARACLADLGTVSIVPGCVGDVNLPSVAVNISHPVVACMASQYAGWQIKVDKFFAMGSGPMRANFGGETLFDDPSLAPFKESTPNAVGVLETSQLPTREVVEYIADKCSISPLRVVLMVAKTASLAGGVQVVARSVETALHKLHELKFDLSQIVGGFGAAPLPPVAGDDMAAIGRTNDAVLYGGQVTLCASGVDDELEAVAKQLPSNSSKDYGRPFGEVFKLYNYDFYKLDPMLFSPAAVCIHNLKTGNVFSAGSVNEDLLVESFFSTV